MTAAIELAKQCGIAYYLTPEGTTEMHGTDRQIQAFADAVAAAERERCAMEVPSNWCDPLLTGPHSLVRATDDCRMVERLLFAVAQRIREA